MLRVLNKPTEFVYRVRESWNALNTLKAVGLIKNISIFLMEKRG